MMAWKKPETEDAWRECLSSYLDGELEADERRAVEAWLARNPARARQMAELRQIGALLQEWTVEAPEPDPAFLSRLEEGGMDKRGEAISNLKSQISNPEWRGWREIFARPLRLPWPVTAAIFLAGVLTGTGGTRLIAPPSKPAALAPRPQQVAVAEFTPGVTPVISDRQATVLLDEVRAGKLKDQLLRNLDGGNYPAALKNFRELQDKYPASAALRQIEQYPNPRLRQLAGSLMATERI